MTQGRRLGRYELQEVEGEGEILTVYRAYDIEDNRPVILKSVQSHLLEDDELVAHFRHRAEALLTLRHPHIAPVLEVRFENDALYLVTATPQGESLELRCASGHPLEVDDVLSIVSQLAEALDYAHEQGVIHHDVRPANIYRCQGASMSGQAAGTLLTNFFVLEAVGTSPGYMAPELLDETSAEVGDRRSDAYALGVLAYTLLTGRPPFEGTPTEVAAAHLTQRPLAPRVHNPDLFPAIDAILLKALAKQPQSRYQSAGELATALYEAVQTAQTRRIADDLRFRGTVAPGSETTSSTPFPSGIAGIPAWVWVGLGIIFVVVVTVIILLATA